MGLKSLSLFFVPEQHALHENNLLTELFTKKVVWTSIKIQYASSMVDLMTLSEGTMFYLDKSWLTFSILVGPLFIHRTSYGFWRFFYSLDNQQTASATGRQGMLTSPISHPYLFRGPSLFCCFFVNVWDGWQLVNVINVNVCIMLIIALLTLIFGTFLYIK